MPKAKRKRDRFEGLTPTPEQIAGFAETWQIADGKRARAYQRVNVIEAMFIKGQLSARQFAGLSRFQDLAEAEDSSPRRDSLDAALQGRGGGSLGLPPGMAAMRLGKDWQSELSWLEGELGSLLAIARAMTVGGKTLSQWAMEQAGAIERRRKTARGDVVWFEPRKSAAKIALVDIRMAGERLAAAIKAA